jgi:uncharacterized protein (DUF169 family)
MNSKVVTYLAPEFEPVAVEWSETLPEDAIEFKPGKFGCILNLFAEASRKGRVAGGSRDTIVCSGARAALGFGAEVLESEAELDRLAAVFSKGLESARDKESYQRTMDAAPQHWQPLYEFGERRHCSFEAARRWIQESFPRHETPTSYVLFKPLSRADVGDDIRAVVFLVSPLELAGLSTLLGSVMDGADPIQVLQGPDCFRITGFAFDQNDAESSRAILGMLDVDGRELMRRRFRDDTLTVTVPMSLFLRIEEEAASSVLTTPRWSRLRGRERRTGE